MKRKLLLALLMFSVTTALCACKGGTDKGDTPGDISSGTPAMGGEIVVGITQDLDSLDPHIAVAAGTDEVLFNIFEGLVKPDKDGNPCCECSMCRSIAAGTSMNVILQQIDKFYEE